MFSFPPSETSATELFCVHFYSFLVSHMNEPQSTAPIVVAALSVIAARLAAGLYVVLMLLILIQNLNAETGGDFVCIGVSMAVILCPLLIVASKSGVEARLFPDRIEEQGFLGHTKTHQLVDCTAVHCGSGRAFSRSIVLQFGRRGSKVMLSNNRRGFWLAAEALKQAQSVHDWELSYGIKDLFKGHFWLPEDERGVKWV
jgi:hypothetical protein